MSEEIPRPTMRQFAREQRARSVTAEAMIWQAVRNRRCHGAKFQRQVILGNFIVDLLCFERQLVVEIDGPSHQTEGSAERDISRDAWLAAQGFRVLRLPSDLVIGSTELAAAEIRTALAK
jgi:very-short-patch-repair endonuclease